MSEKPDPAAVEAAVADLREVEEACRVCNAAVFVNVILGDLRTLLASHAALQAERDEALVEAYARATPIGAGPPAVKRGGQS